MQVFVSHASEDKDFVRPLAHALKESFRVWYDEFELTLGDSLLRQISVGLGSSDYGVVVLSPAFFSKRWPQAELDGLFALERDSKKMILPVWKDIDEAGVAKFSPILAGRLAVKASEGVSRVVEEIKRAIGVAERSRELSQLDGFAVKFKALDSSLTHRKIADERLFSREGVIAFETEFQAICSSLEARLNAIAAESKILKFTSHWTIKDRIFEVRAPFRLRLNLRRVDHAYNSATDARLECVIYEAGEMQRFADRAQPVKLFEVAFAPYFSSSSETVWRSPGSFDRFMSTEQLLTNFIGEFYERIESKSRESLR